MTKSKKNKSALNDVPVLTLRDVVVYPDMVIPLFVGRKKSIHALDIAMESGKEIILVSQRNADVDTPTLDDIYRIGTLATILQLLKLPDGTLKVLVEGGRRVEISSLHEHENYFSADANILELSADYDKRTVEVYERTLVGLFEKYVKSNNKIPPEVLTSLSAIDDPSRLADTVSAHLAIKISDKQTVLEIASIEDRLRHLIDLVENEIDLLQVEKRIRGNVKTQMEKGQREYYLNEKMKAIQKELGDSDDDATNEIDDFEAKIKESGMPEEAESKAKAELNKLKMMSPMSAEATVSRNYIDWLVKVPWKKTTEVSHDLAKAQTILDEDHYGLEEIKERILEYLAVQQRVKALKGPILCLVGPPGVGKTSLGRSIARSTGRKYTRMALGGIRDEAEIRGHRRTYIGALPGKIVQNLARIEARNPLFLLDEIDKMSTDFRGDPSSAMLEVLDPEQNSTFADHFLEVDFDLSDVMFVATANSMNIPGPLLDRMEVIRVPGYTEDEKIKIARHYLVPKQMKNNGVRKAELKISDAALRDIVRHYTREAGVRNIDREISKICRKVIKAHLLTGKEKTSVTVRNLNDFLGVQRFSYGKADKKNQVGQVTGLAWTSVGGELLTIESITVPGVGGTRATGSLGQVMKESIHASETVVKSRASQLGIARSFFKKNNIHIHVPEGATPKDGPSAGVGMVTAIVSAVTKIAVRANVAMTGEITLRGEVLPIGGLKEKLLAAHRGGITTVLIPKENEKDLADIPENVTSKLDIHAVKWIDEVLELALERRPTPLVDEEEDDCDTPALEGNREAEDGDDSDELRH